MNKNSHGFAVVIIILLALALIGTVGYIVYQNTQSEKIAQVNKSEPPFLSPSPGMKTPSSSPTPDPLAGLKTFSNSIYEVKYPPDMKAIEEDKTTLALSMWGPTQKADTEFYDGISLGFTPREISNLQNFVQSQIDEIKNADISEVLSGPDPITVNGYQGLTYTEQGLGTFRIIVLESSNGTTFLEITDGTNDPGKLGFAKTVDQILSTLKFIE